MNRNDKRIKVICTASVIALLMTGCTVKLDKSTEEGNGKTTIETVETGMAKVPESLMLVKSEKINEETEAYIVEVDMPVITGLANKEFEQSINKELSETIATFVETIKTSAIQIQEEGYLTAPCFAGVSYSIQLNNSDYLSLLINYSEYTGGAHGNYYSEASTYDKKTESILSLSDVFKDGVDYMPLLEEEVLKAIENKRKTSEYGDMLHSWYEGLKEEFVVFTLEEDGLGIYFQPYEIGPYAEGAPSFILPYEAFEGSLAITYPTNDEKSDV